VAAEGFERDGDDSEVDRRGDERKFNLPQRFARCRHPGDLE